MSDLSRASRLIPTRTLRALVVMLPELYAQRSVNEFLAFGRHLVERFIPGDYLASLEWRFDSPGPRIVRIEDGDGRTAPYLSRLPEGIMEHPFFEEITRTHAPVVRLSDCPSKAVDRHRSQYRDIYDTLELDYQVGAFMAFDPAAWYASRPRAQAATSHEPRSRCSSC